MTYEPFVSIVIPAYNAEKYIGLVLEAIFTQEYPKEKIEIILVDDNSSDNTVATAEEYRAKFMNFSLIKKEGLRGAAKSTNIGIEKAQGEIVCSIDSDAIISPHWIRTIVEKFETVGIAAVAGYIETGNTYNLWAKLMGTELEDRYDQILIENVDHVSTCNTAYRRESVMKVGMFDEQLYYGYDVDISYKLKKEGFFILLLKNVGCKHYWKETFTGYLKQQFNVAYGRLYLINKYPQKSTGDKVAGMFLFVQVPMLFFIGLFLILGFFEVRSLFIAGLFLILLFIMQLPQMVRVVKKKKEAAYLLLPMLNLFRDFMWGIAFLSYYFDKVRGRTRIKIL